jgi:glycerol-3-phosphate dehydrogenase
MLPMISVSKGVQPGPQWPLWTPKINQQFPLIPQDLLPPTLPIISVSKGIELSTGQLMSDLIPSVLGRKHPTVYLSGPSFAKEVMDCKPTGVVAASKVSTGLCNVHLG